MCSELFNSWTSRPKTIGLHGDWLYGFDLLLTSEPEQHPDPWAKMFLGLTRTQGNHLCSSYNPQAIWIEPFPLLGLRFGGLGLQDRSWVWWFTSGISLMTPWGELGDLEFWLGFPVCIPRTQTLWGNICLYCLILTSSPWTSDVKSRTRQTWSPRGCISWALLQPRPYLFAQIWCPCTFLLLLIFSVFCESRWKKIETSEGNDSPQCRDGVSNQAGNGVPLSDSETTVLTMSGHPLPHDKALSLCSKIGPLSLTGATGIGWWNSLPSFFSL